MSTETKHDRPEAERRESPALSPQETSTRETLSGPDATATRRQTANSAAKITAIATCLISCVAALLIMWKLHPSKTAAHQPTASSSAEDLPPHAPGVVATDQELADPWSSKQFTYRDPISGADLPAMVVRLPDGGYWGFSLVDPIGSCRLEYVRDLDRLQSFYHFQAAHPMVGNPCNLAVFDLLQYGGAEGAEVRGAPVHGMGVRPPIGIEIEQKGNEILATKIE